MWLNNFVLTLLLYLNFLNKQISKINNEGIVQIFDVWKVLNEFLIFKFPNINITHNYSLQAICQDNDVFFKILTRTKFNQTLAEFGFTVWKIKCITKRQIRTDKNTVNVKKIYSRSCNFCLRFFWSKEQNPEVFYINLVSLYIYIKMDVRLFFWFFGLFILQSLWTDLHAVFGKVIFILLKWLIEPNTCGFN